MKKLFAGMSAVAIALTQAGSVFAAYSDVPAGVWYEEAVEAFTDAGYLDATQTRFRGGDLANRAEFTKLIVELNGGILSTPPAVPSFADVATGAWYYGYMEEAAKEGWLKGDNDCYVTGTKPCNARPGANINRAEAAALIVRAFALEATGDAPAFVDVPAGQWYTDVVQTAADSCVLQGDESTGRARPGDNMNRAEMVVMLNRVDQNLTYGVDCARGGDAEAGIKDVTPLSEDVIEVAFTVAVDEEAAAEAASYAISGDADIDVESVEVVDDTTVELTLAEATDADGDYTVTVTDMEAADGETFSDSMDFSGYTEIVLGDGILEVSVASDSPDGDTVPQGAVGVVMLSLDLEASCDDDVTIEEITVLHDGYGLTTDLLGVYVTKDGGRISRRRSLDTNDQTADLRLTNPLTIQACRSETIDIVADIATDKIAGAEHVLGVEMKTDFQSNAKEVTGSFPMAGNTFKLAAVTSGTVTLEYKSVTPATVDVGESKVKVGKFELAADSNEDQAVYSITLEQTGTASDGDLTNLRLARTDGTVLSNTVATTTGDYVTFTFDPPRVILSGDTLLIEVLADTVGGAADTVKFELEELSDLFVVGSLYGKGKSGQLFGSPVARDGDPAATPVTLQAGQLTVEVDGPAQQKYTDDSDDAVLAEVIFTPGAEAVDVRDLFVAIYHTDSAGTAQTAADIPLYVEDVTLRNTKTARSISATAVGASSTAGYYIYRFDDFLIEKQENFELTVDFITGVVANSRFQAAICTKDGACGAPFTPLQNVDAEGVTTGKTLTDIRPGSIVTGSTHIIVAPTVTVAVRSIGATETTVRKAQNINLLRFDVTPGAASDALVTSATFEDAAGNLLNAQNYALWVDSDGDTIVDTILEKGVAASASGGTVTFDDLNGGKGFEVAAEATVIFEVHADVASNPPNMNALQIKMNAMEMEEADAGSSITVTPDTTAGKNYTIVNQGDLFVEEDTKPRSRQILAGTLGDSVLRLELTSQNEDVRVDTIRIAATGATADAAAAISQLEIFKDAETTKLATLSPCTVTVSNLADEGTVFCVNLGTSQLIVKKDTPVVLTVRPRVNNDVLGANSSTGVTFWTGSGGVVATGVQSSNELSVNNNDDTADGEVVFGNRTSATSTSITGSANDIVLAKFSAIANKMPARALPSGIDQEIARFEFTAPTNTNTAGGTNSATLTGVTFTVAATNIDFDSGQFKWYRTDQPTTKIECTASATASTGALKVRCSDDSTSLDTEVKSGQSVSFSLEADVDDNHVTDTSNSSLQVSLTNFSDQAENAFADTDGNIKWTDGYETFFWVENAETTIFSTLMAD